MCTQKMKMVCTKKNQINKTMRTQTSRQGPPYKSQSTWKCAHMDQPHVPF